MAKTSNNPSNNLSARPLSNLLAISELNGEWHVLFDGKVIAAYATKAEAEASIGLNNSAPSNVSIEQINEKFYVVADGLVYAGFDSNIDAELFSVRIRNNDNDLFGMPEKRQARLSRLSTLEQVKSGTTPISITDLE